MENNLQYDITTKRYFDLFKEEHEKALTKLGLKDWKIYYSNEKIEDNYAVTHYDCKSRIATIQLNIEFDECCIPSKESMTKIAKHEAIHLLTADLLSHAQNRFTTQDILDIEEEKIVRTLENLI